MTRLRGDAIPRHTSHRSGRSVAGMQRVRGDPVRSESHSVRDIPMMTDALLDNGSQIHDSEFTTRVFERAGVIGHSSRCAGIRRRNGQKDGIAMT